ncbi:MAG TPA: DUF5060 domain-containing protein [Saprospiraceae bacterium]|nr:DUF5060 domain-containing protein [Saprospiraceae bacterium]
MNCNHTLWIKCCAFAALCNLFQHALCQEITGELKVWHNVTLTLEGPIISEQSEPNPFSDYRLQVTFAQDSTVYKVPGYFAADGNAANTGTDTGNKWRVHFTPDRTGEWLYTVSFRQGTDIAISDDEGLSLDPDGLMGSFIIQPSDKTGRDFRGKGRLTYVHHRYLQYQGSGEFFLKAGADSPETLLACREFDQTYLLSTGAPLKDWTPHLGDWREGDPVWRDSLGKGIIGAINYLAEEDQNAISFLTMNIDGDGDNVWPYADPDQHDRFDCSKLDQWEILFTHCDQKGIYMHFKTQEQENDQLLDGGQLGRMRKLYYRELIARYAHHLGLNWNLGEENTNTDLQRKAFAQFFFDHDPYHHNIVVHTFPGSDDAVYTDLLGNQSKLTGASLQADWNEVHDITLEWVKKSQDAGKPWVVANDEQGIAFIGVPDDAFQSNPTQDGIRKQVLWGNLMAGGAGVEYYFGYALPHNDLNCEDFRSRDRMWDYNRYALQFFKNSLPFWLMQSADSLVDADDGDAFCLSLQDSIFAIYLPEGGESFLDLRNASGIFDISWYNPRMEGDMQTGTVAIVGGGVMASLGLPPEEASEDWAVLVQKKTEIPEIKTLDCAPFNCAEVTLVWNRPTDGSVFTPAIEMSTDGENFTEIAPLTEMHCTQYCITRVPASGIFTYYRLRTAQLYSNTVKCHVPCFGEGRGDIENVKRRKGGQMH